jgi:hypothetical protein
MWQIETGTTAGKIYVTLIVLAFLVLFMGLIPVMQVLPPRGRRALIALVTFFAGLVFAAEFFWPVNKQGENWLTPAIGPAQNTLQIIAAMALALGTYGLIRLHLRNIVQQRSQWGYSVVLIVAFVTMGFFSVWNTLAEKGVLSKTVVLQRGFGLLFDNMLVPLESTMFSLIAFYIFSAAYRAFRIRSIEASILMFTAMMVMIGIVSLGNIISYQWLGLPVEQTAEMEKKSLLAAQYQLQSGITTHRLLDSTSPERACSTRYRVRGGDSGLGDGDTALAEPRTRHHIRRVHHGEADHLASVAHD